MNECERILRQAAEDIEAVRKAEQAKRDLIHAYVREQFERQDREADARLELVRNATDPLAKTISILNEYVRGANGAADVDRVRALLEDVVRSAGSGT